MSNAAKTLNEPRSDSGAPGGKRAARVRKESGVKALILDGDAVVVTTDYDAIAAAHRAKKRFWVDLDERVAQADDLLLEVLHIHPLAIEDIGTTSGSRRSRTSASTSSSSCTASARRTSAGATSRSP